MIVQKPLQRLLCFLGVIASPIPRKAIGMEEGSELLSIDNEIEDSTT